LVDDEVGREEEEASVVGPALLVRVRVWVGVRAGVRARVRVKVRVRARVRVRSAPRSIMMRWLARGSSRERRTTSEMMRSTYS
jgi:hypothetical protein